jgi:hypothetical protein
VIRELYVENGVGRSLTETINRFSRNHGITAVFQHDVHPQMQRRQQGDEWWIADIAGRGMGILTQDSAILGVRQHKQGIITGERQAIIESAAHVFALGNADYTVWHKLQCLAIHWDVIDRLLQKPGPQAATLLLSKVVIENFQ